MMTDLRADLTAAVRAALMDERNGKPCGCIVEAGCEAREYVSPSDAADEFIDDIVAATFRTLKSYGDDLLNELAGTEDDDAYNLVSVIDDKPVGVLGHLRQIRERTIASYDAGTLEVAIDPALIARWREELKITA